MYAGAEGQLQHTLGFVLPRRLTAHEPLAHSFACSRCRTIWLDKQLIILLAHSLLSLLSVPLSYVCKNTASVRGSPSLRRSARLILFGLTDASF